MNDKPQLKKVLQKPKAQHKRLLAAESKRLSARKKRLKAQIKSASKVKPKPKPKAKPKAKVEPIEERIQDDIDPYAHLTKLVQEGKVKRNKWAKSEKPRTI